MQVVWNGQSAHAQAIVVSLEDSTRRNISASVTLRVFISQMIAVVSFEADAK